MASNTSFARMSSAPERSAMVRATLSMRSWARAEKPISSMACSRCLPSRTRRGVLFWCCIRWTIRNLRRAGTAGLADLTKRRLNRWMLHGSQPDGPGHAKPDKHHFSRTSRHSFTLSPRCLSKCLITGWRTSQNPAPPMPTLSGGGNLSCASQAISVLKPLHSILGPGLNPMSEARLPMCFSSGGTLLRKVCTRSDFQM